MFRERIIAVLDGWLAKSNIPKAVEFWSRPNATVNLSIALIVQTLLRDIYVVSAKTSNNLYSEKGILESNFTKMPSFNITSFAVPNKNFFIFKFSSWIENLTEIIALKKEEVILPEITIKNAFRLTIVGNVGLLSIDGLSFPKLKSGFNPFAKIPKPYKIISTANGCFYDNSAKNEAHIRLFDDGTFNLYSNVSKENEVLYSFFSIVFLLKKVF